MKKTTVGQAVLVVLGLGCSAGWAQNVKITPLGSHAGELCDRDRATIFEDPTGVRILYDAGHSVTGGDDPRLGDVHVVLLDHAHGDHMGERKMKALEAGTCEKPETISAAPTLDHRRDRGGQERRHHHDCADGGLHQQEDRKC